MEESRCEGDHSDTPGQAPLEGVAKSEGAEGASASSTETGSETGGGAASPARALGAGPGRERERAVVCEAPNIPNVVEYHLKVKPQQVRQAHLDGCQSDRPGQSDRSLGTTGTPVSVRPAEDMRKDRVAETLTEEQRRELTLRLSKLSVDSNVFEGSSDLPQVFQVKYLGSHDARGLWGIKHTRKPVDNMVAAAKSLPPGSILPFIKLVVSEDGVGLLPLGKRRGDSLSRIYPIESISYGVQDLVYTRVFSMIVVRETEDFRRMSPFECHGFVCESKHHARQMTYALAAAFQIYSQYVKDKTVDPAKTWSKGFAIDLGTPDTECTLDPEDSP